MVRYVPRLADGQRIKLSWPLALYRHDIFFWPLDPSTSPNGRRFYYSLAFVGFLIYLHLTDAELRYLRFQRSNVDAFLTGVPTCLILVESQIRSGHVLWYRAELLQLLQTYFACIYVDRNTEPKVFRKVERKLLPNRLVSSLYLMVVSGYVIAPIIMLIKRAQDYIFPMIPAYDSRPMYIFVPLTLSCVWVGLSIVNMVIGETALLCELLSHLKGRYMLLQRDMDSAIDQILAARQSPHIARQLRQVIVETLRKNVALNRFGEQLENHFTFRIFIMFACCAGLLCALSFKTIVSPTGTYIYPIWFAAKTIELLSLGEIGSDLARMTDSLSTVYYLTRWEQAIYYSSNRRENLRLMKVVAVAIELNHKPYYMTGLKYFSVSLQAVVKILQGAFSYFTFLTSIR
ncbi:odorant receptor 35a [Drosophila grimshawi]|uniref:Odorant receptor n=1 Tax=Drosophila grimshawi TaxID=7222 RepID=B4JQV6_DROGR|nr:odorant receptor 35a [Drosophila grimshawi]EDV99286.1 GH13109 [Drosophila grimshawi]